MAAFSWLATWAAQGVNEIVAAKYYTHHDDIHLLSVGGLQQVCEGRGGRILECEEGQSPLQLLQHAAVLLPALGEVLGGVLERLLHLLAADELDEVLLLEVEQEVAVVVQQLRVQLVHQRDGLQNMPSLN